MRIIELKELNNDDQRKVFTKLVCVYFENKNSSVKALEENNFIEDHADCFLQNGSSPVTVGNELDGSDNSDSNLKRSFSTSNVSSSRFELKSGKQSRSLSQVKC